MTRAVKIDKPMMCSICHYPIPVQPSGWRGGNNAQPVNDGRCCDDCNAHVVIPTRLRNMGLLSNH